MSIVTLLSDWGVSDHYLASVKGKLYLEWPEVTIVDISHQIPKFDIISAVYVFRNAYINFPKGTIHCIGINDIITENKPPVLIKDKGHYFIGTDNGIFERIFDEKPEKTWRITLLPDGSTLTFPSLDLFPLIVSHIGKGGDPDDIGYDYHWGKRDFSLNLNKPVSEEEQNQKTGRSEAWLHGNVIYVDSYGNAVTNIDIKTFEYFFTKYEHFEIKLQKYYSSTKKKGNFSSINKVYKDDVDGDLCALFLGNGLLEISLNLSSAANLLNIRLGSDVKIYFY